MLLPLSFSELVLACFASTMTSPTTLNLLRLLPGWLLAPRRTITAMIQSAGLSGKLHHARFHRLFASARWSLDKVGLALFLLARAYLPQDAVIFLGADDTLARKRGLKVFGVGMHHDPLLSSRAKAIVNWGHKIVLGVILPLPFRPEARFCLPLLCQAHPTRHFHLLADATYSGASEVRQLPEGCDFTGRGNLKANLCAPAPERPPGVKGRSRVRGARLPAPRAMLAGPDLPTLTLKIYSRQAQVRVASCRALWYSVAHGRPLHLVAVSPLAPGGRMETFFSTCLAASAEQILIWYSWRWTIEVTFHESKGYLGFEEPQGWSRRAVERTAPLALLLYSLVLLWFAREGHQHVQFPCRPWYRKKSAISFADMLRTLRRLGLERRFVRPPEWEAADQNELAELIHLASWIP